MAGRVGDLPDDAVEELLVRDVHECLGHQDHGQQELLFAQHEPQSGAAVGQEVQRHRHGRLVRAHAAHGHALVRVVGSSR